MKISMFRTDTGIIKTCRNRINGSNRTIFILTEIGFHSVENPKLSRINCCGSFKGINSSACCFTADKPYAFIINKIIKAAYGI